MSVNLVTSFTRTCFIVSYVQYTNGTTQMGKIVDGNGFKGIIRIGKP